MKIIIFAGGIGTRMWPLSRKAFPKQFIKMFDGKSTLEMALERIKGFGYENILVSTLEEYVPLTKKYLPELPEKNIVAEPALRNLAPAIGYNLIKLRKQGYRGPVVTNWADHLIKDLDTFLKMLKDVEQISIKNPDKILFVGKKPRTADTSLGWINFGTKVSSSTYKYKGWVYKPSLEKCKEIFSSNEWLWNTGYFVMDLHFGCHLYQKYQPEMYKILCAIEDSLGTKKEKDTIKKLYPTMERIHFDNAIAMKVTTEEALIVETKMEWSDPGSLYLLKEALIGAGDDNLEKGNVINLNSKDSTLVNNEKSKLLAVVGVDGMVVVNTKDAILVVPKEKVKEISDLLEEIGKNKKLHKYL